MKKRERNEGVNYGKRKCKSSACRRARRLFIFFFFPSSFTRMVVQTRREFRSVGRHARMERANVRVCIRYARYYTHILNSMNDGCMYQGVPHRIMPILSTEASRFDGRASK